MLFEALTASALGWWIGVAMVVVVPLALASLALLAPVALEEGRLPAGFNPDQWRSLGLLATSQHAPWSLALMGAQRLSMLFGGATAIFLTGVLYYVGHAGRLHLQSELAKAQRDGADHRARVTTLQGRIDALDGRLTAALGEADRQRQSAAACEQRVLTLISEAGSDRRDLSGRLAEETRRRETAELAQRQAAESSARDVERFNAHLRDLNRQIADQCPMMTPIPRPGTLPEDPEAPRPPAPPFGQRPPPRPPFR